MRGSVGLLPSPQTLRFPLFEAATNERQKRCGGSGLGSFEMAVELPSMPSNRRGDFAETKKSIFRTKI